MSDMEMVHKFKSGCYVYGPKAGIAEVESLIQQRDELLAALIDIFPYVEDIDDAGPAGFGWQSDELSKKICAARSVIEKSEAQS